MKNTIILFIILFLFGCNITNEPKYKLGQICTIFNNQKVQIIKSYLRINQFNFIGNIYYTVLTKDLKEVNILESQLECK